MAVDLIVRTPRGIAGGNLQAAIRNLQATRPENSIRRPHGRAKNEFVVRGGMVRLGMQVGVAEDPGQSRAAEDRPPGPVPGDRELVADACFTRAYSGRETQFKADEPSHFGGEIGVHRSSSFWATSRSRATSRLVRMPSGFLLILSNVTKDFSQACQPAEPRRFCWLR